MLRPGQCSLSIGAPAGGGLTGQRSSVRRPVVARLEAAEHNPSVDTLVELSRKRGLRVLENAVTLDEVRPLLPGGPGCAVRITSLDALPRNWGPVATERRRWSACRARTLPAVFCGG